MKVTAELVESMAGIYLSDRYDTLMPTPEFHRECWRRYCSDSQACATAAPRGHAKSTGLTHDYTLAIVLFREEKYVILIGASEEMAIEHLGDIANELRENDELRQAFKIKNFITDQKTDIIVECEDGYQFRIMARGAEQKIRGKKWRGGRPGLIVGDDLEDDEQVESKERREKFRRWFFRAAKQSLRDGGKIRVHGTILHDDSLLMHLIKNKGWNSRLYRAHESFSNFTNILWPEKFPETRLRAIRQEFINEGDSAGYSQEMLNDPRDNDAAYLRKEQFLPMGEDDHDSFKRLGAGVDFAISKADRANRTSITIGGKDLSNVIHVLDQRAGRLDSLEIIDELFSVQERWQPEVFYVEDGVIWKSIWPMIQQEMLVRDVWMNFQPMKPVNDKAARGRSFQKRMKAGSMRFDKQASWYDEYEDELLRFSVGSEAVQDDQFDSTVWLVRGMEDLNVESEDQMTEDELAEERQSVMLRKAGHGGRSLVTGY